MRSLTQQVYDFLEMCTGCITALLATQLEQCQTHSFSNIKVINKMLHCVLLLIETENYIWKSSCDHLMIIIPVFNLFNLVLVADIF